MQVKEIKETIEGDRCITFFAYCPKTNKKYYSDTFVINTQTNTIRLKRDFIKGLRKINPIVIN